MLLPVTGGIPENGIFEGKRQLRALSLRLLYALRDGGFAIKERETHGAVFANGD